MSGEALVEALARVLHSCNEFEYGECDHGTYTGGPSRGQPYVMCERMAGALAPVVAEHVAGERDRGVRQAIDWLRAGYEYGTGPDWRENGAEWIAECATTDRLARADREANGDGRG